MIDHRGIGADEKRDSVGLDAMLISRASCFICDIRAAPLSCVQAGPCGKSRQRNRQRHWVDGKDRPALPQRCGKAGDAGAFPGATGILVCAAHGTAAAGPLVQRKPLEAHWRARLPAAGAVESRVPARPRAYRTVPIHELFCPSSTPISYKDAGVDIVAGDALVERIKPLAKKTMREGVMAGIGGFGALFEVPKRYKEPVLVSGTDGVGTKLNWPSSGTCTTPSASTWWP